MRDWIEQNGTTVALLVGAVVVGFLLANVLARPTPAPIEIRPRETPPTPIALVHVHIDGAVNSPGLYRLEANARVFDAIEAAGGAADEANVSGLNLAAKLADGQKLVVPTRVEPGAVAALASEPAAVSLAGSSGPTGAGRININTATQRILESLPGIGPVTAQRIIQFRGTNGPFTRIDQLRNAGVNAATFERIKDMVSVE